MSGFIGDLAEMVPTAQVHTSNQQINDLFIENKKCSGIVILEDNKPMGLITRMNFYQKMGSLYGYNLYMNRSIDLLMNKNILTVDYSLPIIEVSRLAMSREEEELYDYVIVTKHGLFEGVVSISRLLMKFAEVQAQIASYLNPLTGLPGNHSIEEQLKETINQEKFSVLYIDLDNFKAYNDVYGFSKGDQLIQSTASLIRAKISNEKGFLGHIGGDDFLAILDHYDYEECCSMILQEFDQMIPSFYSEEHLEQNFVFTEDRMGVKRKIPLVSLSIAVVSNQNQTFINQEEIVMQATKLKRVCKQCPGSIYVDAAKAEDLLMN